MANNPNFDLLSLSGVFDPLFYSADGAPPDAATTRLSQAPPINVPLNAEAIAPTRRNPPARTSLLGKRRPDPDDEVKRQQSISARESRRRKKEHIQTLEQKVQDLEAELSELKRRTNPYTREQLIEEKTKIVQRLQQLMKQRTLAAKGRRGAVIQTKTDEEIVECLREIRRLGTDDVWLMMQHHFSKIHELLIPFPFVKFILWGLDQGDEFFAPDQTGKLQGVWGLLVGELGLTQHQRDQLIAQRKEVGHERTCIAQLVSQLKVLNENIRSKLEELMVIMRNMQDILTPKQQVKFLEWAEKNQVAMELITQMWNQDVGVPAKNTTPLTDSDLVPLGPSSARAGATSTSPASSSSSSSSSTSNTSSSSSTAAASSSSMSAVSAAASKLSTIGVPPTPPLTSPILPMSTTVLTTPPLPGVPSPTLSSQCILEPSISSPRLE